MWSLSHFEHRPAFNIIKAPEISIPSEKKKSLRLRPTTNCIIVTILSWNYTQFPLGAKLSASSEGNWYSIYGFVICHKSATTGHPGWLKILIKSLTGVETVSEKWYTHLHMSGLNLAPEMEFGQTLSNMLSGIRHSKNKSDVLVFLTLEPVVWCWKNVQYESVRCMCINVYSVYELCVCIYIEREM